MSDVTRSGILYSLKKVDDPDFNKNHLLLNVIKSVEVKKDIITVNFVLPIPSNKLSDSLKRKFSEAIKKDFPAYKNIILDIETKVLPHQNAKKDSLLPGVKNTIAVASGTGGVGKNT